MNTFFRTLLVLAAVCVALPAQAAQTFTLDEAVEHALKANPSVEAKLLLLDQARLNVSVAQSYFWPRVSLVASRNKLENSGQVGSVDEMSNKSRSHGMRVNWSLFAGFAHLTNLQKSYLNVDVEQARHHQARLELITNVQLQFLKLLELRDQLKSAEESVKRITTQLSAAQSFVNVGMAPYLNVLQNEVDLATAQQQVIRVRNDIRNTEVQLNKFLAFSPDEPITYKGKLDAFTGMVTYNEEEAINTALFSRPDLIVAQKTVAIAYKDVNSRLGEFLPRVDANYDDMRFKKDYDDKRQKDYSRSYWAVGLNFSWEIFSGGGTYFATQGERKRAQAMQKNYEDAMSGAKTDVIRALLDIKAAQELIAVSRKGVVAAQESYNMANKRYLTHTGTVTDLLDAQLKLTRAENEASRALMEYHSARAQFYYYIGRENPGLI